MSTATTLTPIDTGIELLRKLALDLRCSWNHASDALWSDLDPELWARTHNPWVVLQSASRERLAHKLTEPVFRETLERLTREKAAYAKEGTWFQQTHPNSGLDRIYYFSMEFMLSEALPIYAGGLGNVAGDQLKAASDLGVPVVGVGIVVQPGLLPSGNRP